MGNKNEKVRVVFAPKGYKITNVEVQKTKRSLVMTSKKMERKKAVKPKRKVERKKKATRSLGDSLAQELRELF